MNEKKLRTIDIKLIDNLFEMGGGYVLDFSNQTFSEFFIDELGVNIYDHAFDEGGTSKAKRLRCYLRHARIEAAIKALLALWEYRETIRRRSGEEEQLPHLKNEFFQLIERLGGKPPEALKPFGANSELSNLNAETAAKLHKYLINVSALEPQAKGYAFEKFLKDLFDANGLMGRASFRIVGEQIDGSFELNGETYLLEAKWTGPQVNAADLRSFNAKVEDKAAWSRGLFVSNSGFSEDGWVAFGKGKRLVCMDGLDISEMLQQSLSFADVLARKVRRAAEIGCPFVRVRDLY